jgi:crotonobetaine/carnitine-CoA ligase
MANPPFGQLTLPLLLEKRARERGAHPFLVWAPFEGPSRTWTYAQFAEEVARIAGGLAARGVCPGDRVLVHMENCPELLLAWFACLHLGAIGVVTNAMAAGPELAYFADFSGAVGAVTEPKFASLVGSHCAGLQWVAVTQTSGAGSFDALKREPLPARALDPMAGASIMFTSGTTSRPKAVLWSQANAVWGGSLGAMQQGLRAEDVYQVFLPLFHVIGLSWSVLPTLWAGATVVLQPKFSASRFWPTALEHRASVASHVAFSTNVLLQQPVPPEHGFRVWGSSIWIPEQERQLRARVLGWWGMTEMVSQGIIGDLHAPQAPRSIGRPSPGYQLKVTGEGGAPVAPEETGDLLVKGVRGVTVFAEYFRNPEATKEAFDADGYFRTGDRVRLHPDGSLQFVDRAKDVYRVGSENVSPSEVERVVAEVAGVREAALVGRPDAALGEVGVAFITLKSSAPADIAAKVIERCARSLAKFKVPREVIVLEELPRVGNSKVDKNDLRGRLATPGASAPMSRAADPKSRT